MVDLVYYQGGKFLQRGLDMLLSAQANTSFQFFVVQGGFNPGGVDASAGTHDREAVDIGGSLLTPDQRWEVCKNLRRVGFAAWIRTPAQGFAWHIHGVPKDGDLSIAARAQVVQYTQRLNGLAGRGPDDGPTGYYDMTWEKYQATPAYRPPINTGDYSKPGQEWLTMADANTIVTAIHELGDRFQSDGIAGAGDRAHNGVGENTQAIHELGDRLSGNLDGLGGKLDTLNAAITHLIEVVQYQKGAAA